MMNPRMDVRSNTPLRGAAVPPGARRAQRSPDTLFERRRER